MARRLFWADPASRVDSTSGVPIGGANVTVWTRRTGGTQVTDLQSIDDDGVLTGAVSGGILVCDAQGYLPSFAGPTDGRNLLWADAGIAGGRKALMADLGSNTGDNTTLVAGDGSLIPISTFPAVTHSHAVADLPAGGVIARFCVAGTWQVRGTTRTDLLCLWVKLATSDADPAINSTYMQANDILLRRT
jgi:hypothetical protein